MRASVRPSPGQVAGAGLRRLAAQSGLVFLLCSPGESLGADQLGRDAVKGALSAWCWGEVGMMEEKSRLQ